MSTGMDSLQAADPARNASVHASAGTGKTWLLVTRIIRLLLGGTTPDSILAITFTRKAAAEMQQRVTERLRELMAADPQQLDDMLVQCGVSPDAATRTRARQLYEASLFNPYTLRATTFHAFCQELLQRFPLEAGVSPGFDLIESSGLLEQAARDALVAETARDPGGEVARALGLLVEGCEGLDSARSALTSFLSHRSDWWAFIEDQPDAYAWAQGRLTAQLGIGPDDDPLQGFPDRRMRTQLQTFAQLLEKNTTPTNHEHAELIVTALAGTLDAADILACATSVIFTGTGTPRVRKAGPTQRKRLGEQGEQQFLDLHATLASELGEVRDRCARFRTLQTNLAWYTAGMQLLKHYQRIKQEQRLLDFADLEWTACQLLNRSDHASWVQYKLDARIDHLLVDEFQDTNPTQWRLLLPLLEELAAGNAGRTRSVFLVGDRKQSIYGFRRANPALLDEASGWLEARLQARKYPLDASRRSAQAIIDCVNTVFSEEPLKQRITAFNPHSTHHPDLYGRVEILPLVTTAEPETAQPVQDGLRNPLLTPRLADADPPHSREGRLIAAQITALIGAGTRVVKNDTVCTLDYGDIIILLRQRTHATSYERALREAGIPYASASRGELLDNLEVRDLEALLTLLISPYANLELAQVLRSPLFGLSSEQLWPLARRDHRTWYERLGGLAREAEPVYQEIHAVLEGWRALTGKIPVHDLLDRIYHEADVMQRYQAAFPVELRTRVQASLTRFIELALELDNGRYPSLPHFLDQLTRLRQSAHDQPDEGTPDDCDGQRVRLLTIHGAKGLEAPVIFLADSAATPRNRSANEALVIWPPGKAAPDQFLLTGKKALQDPVSQALLENQQQDSLREDANLLYVAMTRARQYLFISGSAGKQSKDANWYTMIRAAVAAWQTNSVGHLVHESGKQPGTLQATGVTRPAIEPDRRLSERIPRLKPELVEIAPSKAGGAGDWQAGDADGRERGIAIHAMLDWLAEAGRPDVDTLPARLANTLGRAPENPELQEWWQEAVRTYRNKDFADLFNPDHYQDAMNEVPVQFMDKGNLIYGIIDRVVRQDNAVIVIDYKTHRSANSKQLPALTEDYREQMRLYARAAALLWPEHTIRACLLFTNCSTLVPLGKMN
jgi:ATP-dependent helicase/nuclease subunit A